MCDCCTTRPGAHCLHRSRSHRAETHERVRTYKRHDAKGVRKLQGGLPFLIFIAVPAPFGPTAWWDGPAPPHTFSDTRDPLHQQLSQGKLPRR